MFPPLATANLAFRNQGDLTFTEVGKQWGFDLVGVSNGMALADLDNDGDLDVVINNLSEPVAIYRNETVAPRLTVRLKGLAPNTHGIGAKIEVFGGPVPQSQEMVCGGRYLSCDDAIRTFAAGNTTNALRIEVTWRNGKRSLVTDAQPNRLYEIEEPEAGDPASQPQAHLLESVAQARAAQEQGASYWFKDVSSLLGHSHHDDPFDDFVRQPLLPRKFSQLGPGVSWSDLNGDGFDDLIIPTGRGGQLAVFLNQRGNGFERMHLPVLDQIVTRDQTTVLAWCNAQEEVVLLAGLANYEDGLAAGACVRRYNLHGGSVDDALPGESASVGPLALGDVDGDGDLDLFVGGRIQGGRYPESVSSLLFRNENGRFVLDAGNSEKFAHLGLVSGAVFSDLDGDGFPDLILACEWGPIRVFKNHHGQFTEATEELGLSSFTGWWNGVTTGDFDGDGKLDIVASNWGRNSKYESKRADGLRLYYGDVAGRGTVDLIEAYFDRDQQRVVPRRTLDVLSASMPFLRELFPNFHAFANAGVQDLLVGRFETVTEVHARWLDSTVFLNRGDHFEARSLPSEAQFAPAFGIVAGDFDGDGNEDLFLSQNFFPVEPETSRYDAGRGLLLRGTGRGGFSAISADQSGLAIYGDQRGCGVADFDGDGRLDLAVTQNANATKLYRNVLAKPGLRVRLRGPPGNPCGIGANLQLRFGARGGLVHEVHGGSGYWSQDSPVSVLPLTGIPTELVVRWPGGTTTTVPVPVPTPTEVQVAIGP
jgi:hypothetical protein